jgi:uncharacterized membrane protein SirB2
MSALFYQVLHLAGVILLFFALGGLALRAFAGGSGSDDGRKVAQITHGIALVLLLVSGFGLLAKLQLGFPTWVWLKLGIWLTLGGIIVLVRRMHWHRWIWWVLLPAIGILAAWLGNAKPAL